MGQLRINYERVCSDLGKKIWDLRLNELVSPGSRIWTLSKRKFRIVCIKTFEYIVTGFNCNFFSICAIFADGQSIFVSISQIVRQKRIELFNRGIIGDFIFLHLKLKFEFFKKKEKSLTFLRFYAFFEWKGLFEFVRRSRVAITLTMLLEKS